MRYLLDSHVFLWYDEGGPQLKDIYRAMLDDPENELFLSVASLWELSVKRSIGRLERSSSFYVAAQRLGIQVISVTAEHAEAIESLPRHHGDPFDHMLIAQVRLEDLILVTHDEAMTRYSVPTLRV
ncbi:MAG TPA: type II toxin-antitoxin system VapC family toxin [Acidobacteriaceae bacterium]|nr:type II toxin-antitoxin system VapC family toxin [Acidobacteriaceae bacterium]